MNPTKRQQWAKQRNWTIFRNKGIRPVFSGDIVSLVKPNNQRLLTKMQEILDVIISDLQDSKWEDK